MKNDKKLNQNDDRPLILLVDDEPSNIFLVMLIAALRDRYQIKTATNGRAALDIVSQHPKPDLILLDVMMPDMDGYHVCRILKNNPETKNIAIIFITGETENEHEVQGLELGAIDYIRKPYHIKAVLSRIHNHITRKIQIDRLLENERHIQQLNTSNSNDMFRLERDPNGLIKLPFIGSEVLKLYGIHAEDIRYSSQPLIDAIIRDDLPKVFASFNRSWKNLTFWRCEYRIYTHEGQVKWLLAESSPQPLENGNILWIGTVSDISKHKREEKWLRFADCDLKLDDLALNTIPALQNNFTPIKLEIDFNQRCLHVGQQHVSLPPADLAFYAWLASRCVEKLEPVACPPDGAPIMEYAVDFLSQYRKIIGELGDDERVTSALKAGMDKAYFLSRKSRVNKAIHAELNNHSALYYEIKCFGKRPRSVYAIDAAPGQIIFPSHSMPI